MNQDEAEFGRWAQQRQVALLRTALLLTGDRQRAEDLVQEALTQVALRWRRLADDYPEAYARQVIVRRNISWWRKHRHEVVVELSDGVATSGGPEGAVERRLMLGRALAGLTPRQRSLVVLRYYEDLTVRDAADALGVSVGTVKSETHHALRRLRESAPELAQLIGEDR
ncbi:SigE family RNA polymerase sigma factor [Nocardioides conyzicola]|uniref:SigE family RNA polymerase sigma factor n=1 Tax=Nocardioides conyzicola TaxID=1651781 RepID=UPI0031E647C0